MQSFILCAGKGTRLAPLTDILPKPLIPVFQKSLVEHIMDKHYAAGVRQFICNVSQHEMMWGCTFPKDSYKDCPLLLSYEESPLDSGGGLKKIMPLIDKSSPLLVQNGDIYTDIPIDELLAAHKASGKKLTLALRSVDGHKNVGFDPQTGLVTDMRYALQRDKGSYQFAGIYIMDPSLAEFFPQTEEDCEFSIVPLWIDLIRQGEVAGAVFDWAQWYEMGTPEQYLESVLEIPNSQRIHPTASISPQACVCEDSVVGKLAKIHPDVKLIDCIVWPRTHIEAGTYRRCIITPRITVQC